MPRMLNVFVLLIAAALPLASTAAKRVPHAPQQTAPEGKLPNNAEPLHYQLHFAIDPSKDRFDGDAVLTVQLNAPSDHFWLHGRALKVSSSVLTDSAGNTLPVRYRQVTKEGVSRVDFGRTLPAQTVSVHFRYSAAFNTGLEGLYKVQRDGTPYVMTQMEAVSARWAFPGFDEPRFKTPYAISMTIPADLVGVANTLQTSEEPADGGKRKTLYFAPTLKLPTYLIAMAVGPWEVSETATLPPNALRSWPVNLRVLGPKGSSAGFGYVLKTTPALVAALEDYFALGYPFDKLDLLAAPDFAPGAMENPGLITFLDSLLVLDENASLSARQDYIRVNAHELAHQWFGDLVTPAWWDDIWLNEAFATWMGSKVVHQLYPEWGEPLHRLQGTQTAMASDSLVSARRIREPVNGFGDIAAAFDGITYRKGAAVLGMLENWIGPQKFQQGVRDHMLRHALGSATADDLLAALQTVSGRGEKFSAAARSFLDQPGLPLLAVTPQCEDGKGRLLVKQSRYLPLGSPGAPAGPDWQIPACFKLGRAGSEPDGDCVLLEAPETTLDVGSCPLWVMPNAEAAGYYRFTLPATDFAALGEALPKLSAAEQLAYGDAVAASFARGEAGPDEVLAALAATAYSTQPGVVTSQWVGLDFLRTHLLKVQGEVVMRQRLGKIYAPALERLGTTAKPVESADDSSLRTELYRTLGLHWAVPAFREPLRGFGAPLLPANNSAPLELRIVPSDLRGIVLGVLLQEHGEAMLPRVLALLAVNRDPQDRAALLYGLGQVTDPKLVPKVRELALSESLQYREMLSLLRNHSHQPANLPSYFGWLKAEMPRLRKRVGEEQLTVLPRYAALGMCSKAEAAALSGTFKPMLPKMQGGQRTMAQELETVQLCAALKTAQADWRPTDALQAP